MSTYKIMREIDNNSTPTEWDTKGNWQGLTEDQVTKFLNGNAGDPYWYGSRVKVVNETTGEEFDEGEWLDDHSNLDEVSADDLDGFYAGDESNAD